MSSQHWDRLADGSIASAVAGPPHKTSMGSYLVASAGVDLNCNQGDAYQNMQPNKHSKQ